MNCFDILSRDTPLKSRLFLEASAGTGKTFTIEHLVVRLLLETDLRLDEIVIVTFTRAATRELKERIHQNLKQVVQAPLDYPYLQGLSDLQKRKVRMALKNFDTAQIFTIHGFCSHLLRHFALEAGVGLQLSEWTREEQEWEVKEFLRTQTVLSAGQTRRLLGSMQYDISHLTDKLLQASDRPRSVPSSAMLLKEVQDELIKVPFFKVTEEFKKIRPSYKGMTSEEFVSQARVLEESLLQRNLSPKTWEDWIASSSFFLKNLDPSQLKVRAKPVFSEKLLHLKALILPRLELAQNTRQIFLNLLGAWLEHRKKISSEQEKITPDDLLHLVHSKLFHPPFVEAIRKKYQAAIVDEFQDTDPLQWEIFKTLFVEEPKKHIYLVGDPKQSIYAFRQADIYTFLEASTVFDLDQKAALIRNYRSSSQLLGELNRLLCQTPWMDLPKQGTYLDIPQTLAAHEGEGKLCFMRAEGEKGRSTKWPTSEMEEKLFFPFILEEIQKNKLKPSEVAVLVKDRFQAQRIRQFFDRWDMPSVLYRSAPLNQSPVLQFVSEVIDACLYEQNLSAIKKFLLGPFASIPLCELSAELVFQTKEKMKTLQKVWMEEGFASFFAEFLKTSFGKQTALMTFYEFQEHAHYEDLLELTQKILFVSHPSQLKQLLEDLNTYETEDRICTHPDGIQIMTTHASKGLEFETVFALGLASRSPSYDLSEEELQELDAEKMRQVYVALTRAKKRLYIPIAHELPTTNYATGEGSPMEIFLSKAHPNLSSFSQVFLNEHSFDLKPYQKISPGSLIPPPPLRPASIPRFMHSFSSLVPLLTEKMSVHAKGETPPEKMQSLDPGIQTGLIVHRILERYFNQEGDLLFLIIQETKHTKLASHIDMLYDLLQKTLNLSLDGFSLRDISFKEALTEMEFLYSTPQGWMKGYIDLCFEYHGLLYLVDWKTNRIENTERTTLLQAMQTHDYLLQGKIYTEAMERYLKRFPSLSFGGIYFIFIRGPAFYHYLSTHSLPAKTV